MRRLLLALYLSLVPKLKCDEADILGVWTPDPTAIEACPVGEYWSSASFACKPCPAGGVGDYSTHERASRCVCDSGSFAHCAFGAEDNQWACTCELCPESVLSDASACAECGPSTSGVAGGECVCASASQRLLERNSTGGLLLDGKACASCPRGSVKKNAYECELCASEHMISSSDGRCECVSPYQKIGLASLGNEVCAPAAQVGEVLSRHPTPVEARFERVQRSDESADDGEATLSQPLWMAHLYPWAATKCAYHDGGPESDRACHCLINLCALSRYDHTESPCGLLAELRASRSALSQPRRLPEVWWRGDASGWVVPMSMTPKTKLRFELAKYALNGTLLGYERLSTQLFWGHRRAPWTGTGLRVTSWLRFGTSFASTFEARLDDELLSAPLFYEIFLAMDDGRWLPLPVEARVARHKQQYVSRFFLVDTYSGLTDAAKPRQPSILRYARSIRLALEARRDGAKNKIRPPRIELVFRERLRNAIVTRKSLRIDLIAFEASYSAVPNKRLLWGFAFAAFSATIALTAMSLALGTSSQPDELNRHMLLFSRVKNPVGVVVTAMSSFVVVFLPLCLAVATYHLCAFKLQDHDQPTRFLLPSSKTAEKMVLLAVQPMVAALWAAQTVVVIALIARQASVEFGMVDWEDADIPSSWRAIFVANEIAELRSERATSLAFTLAFLAYVLIGLNVRHNATPQPNFEDRHGGGNFSAQGSPILDFANTAWWFIIVSFGQLLFRGAVLHVFCATPNYKRIVDLCSLARISIFSDKFYIHGDAPHKADKADLADLANTLVADKWEGASGREYRVVVVSPNFVKAWRDVKATGHLTGRESIFLKTFLSHGYADDCGADFAVIADGTGTAKPGQCVLFIPDSTNRPFPFNKYNPSWLQHLSLLAHEATLLAHELLTLVFVQLVCTNNNHAAAISATFALHKIMDAFAACAAKPNLAKQAQVDQRFLV